MHSAKSMAHRSKKPSRQAAMLEPTVLEGCGKSVDGAELIQVGTKNKEWLFTVAATQHKDC